MRRRRNARKSNVYKAFLKFASAMTRSFQVFLGVWDLFLQKKVPRKKHLFIFSEHTCDDIDAYEHLADRQTEQNACDEVLYLRATEQA